MNKIKLLALLATLILAITACGKAQGEDDVADNQIVEEVTADEITKSEDESKEEPKDSKDESDDEKTKKDESEPGKVEFEKVESDEGTTADRLKDRDLTVPEIDDSARQYSHNTVIVMVKEGTAESQVQQICDSYNLEIKYSYNTISGYSLSSKKDLTDKELNELIKSIEEYNFVLSVEKDYVVELDGDIAQ